jgi:cytoskeletal protein CcmA (bactofilin family)
MFSRNHQVAPGRAGRRNVSFSVIGPDVVVTGDLATHENLQVSGRIEGDVRCAQLQQAASGAIVGNITADEVHLCGLVEGTVTASLVFVEATARVTGEISYTTVSIESGARVEGRLVYHEAEEEVPGRTSLSDIFPHDDTAIAAE